MAYETSGSLTTDKRTVSDQASWATQTEWEAYQSAQNVNITSGTVKLADYTPPDSTVAWYDASQLTGYSDGDTVSTFDDFSGNGNAATSGAGVYRASGINSKPAIEFGGSNSYDMPTFLDGASSAEVIGVIDSVSSSSIGAVFSYTNSSSNPAYIYEGSWYQSFARDARDSTPQPSGYDQPLIINVVSSDNFRMRQNNSDLVNSTTGNFTTATIYTPELGGFSSAYFSGEISEMLFYDSELTTTQRDNEHQRLADKWGISI